jgi:hypothetical protein
LDRDVKPDKTSEDTDPDVSGTASSGSTPPPPPPVKAIAQSAVDNAASAPGAPAGPVAQCPVPGPSPAGASASSAADQAHYQDLGQDPAVGRFRPSEAETALRVEAQEGVKLKRFTPTAPGAKGDWIDPATKKVYDGCSPPKSEHFDKQLDQGNYQKSLLAHVDHPTVDKVVIDTTNLGLTKVQADKLEAEIKKLTPDQRAKIVRVPK